MATLEEGQRLLNTLRTFYIIITCRPYGFVQAESRGEMYLCVWSSNTKAKRFIFEQGKSPKDNRVVGMDADTLKAFSDAAGIRKMFLDVRSEGKPDESVFWFYMGSVGVQ